MRYCSRWERKWAIRHQFIFSSIVQNRVQNLIENQQSKSNQYSISLVACILNGLTHSKELAKPHENIINREMNNGHFAFLYVFVAFVFIHNLASTTNSGLLNNKQMYFFLFFVQFFMRISTSRTEHCSAFVSGRQRGIWHGGGKKNMGLGFDCCLFCRFFSIFCKITNVLNVNIS